jgi:LmbE family N-acetylglucosaminyl deacetylase
VSESSHVLSFDGPVGFISPHFDDVVLSCAAVITPASVVVTLFSAGPASVDPLPLWDRECGWFKPGDNVPAIRELEDDDSLALFSAKGERLGFWDEQYRLGSMSLFSRARRRAARVLLRKNSEPELVEAVISRLASTITDSGLRTWFAPLGVRHGDHKLTSAAVLQLARKMPERQWLLYAELPYALEQPDEAADAHRRFADAGFSLQAVSAVAVPHLADKWAAVSCYRSQLGGLGHRVEFAVRGPESYYRLVDETA